MVHMYHYSQGAWPPRPSSKALTAASQTRYWEGAIKLLAVLVVATSVVKCLLGKRYEERKESSMSNERIIRVAIAEDQRLVTRMLGRFIDAEPDMEIVGEAYNGKGAIALCQEKVPDVVLMDVSMPIMDGISATRKIRELMPETKILILTAHASDTHVFNGIKAGAKGYLLKSGTPEELAGAIRTVVAGDTIVSPEIAQKALTLFEQDRKGRKSEPTPRLTDRELEILTAIAQGMSRKEIAQSLYISENTVRNHTANIYDKLHIYDRTQATLYAVRHGLVDPDHLEDA